MVSTEKRKDFNIKNRDLDFKVESKIDFNKRVIAILDALKEKPRSLQYLTNWILSTEYLTNYVLYYMLDYGYLKKKKGLYYITQKGLTKQILKELEREENGIK